MRDLADHDIYSAEYNQKVRELIKDCLQKNDNSPIDQPSLIPILVEASKSFLELKPSKNDWFKLDETNLLKLISEKNVNEWNFQLTKTTII